MADELPIELEGGWFEYDTRVGQGQRRFLCKWEHRYDVAPPRGQTYPGEPRLRCAKVRFEPSGPAQPALGEPFTYCTIIADYATFSQIDDAPVESWEFSGEMLETALGRTWQTTGTVCDQAQSTYYPTTVWRLTLVLPMLPDELINRNRGRLNWTWFRGQAPETLLFEGASAEDQFDYDRGRYIFRVTFNFLQRSMSHNVIWRAPRQKRDTETGALVYDEENNPVFVDGPAGVGGWDRPIPQLYDVADFGPMIGMAPNPVPDRPYMPYR